MTSADQSRTFAPYLESLIGQDNKKILGLYYYDPSDIIKSSTRSLKIWESPELSYFEKTFRKYSELEAGDTAILGMFWNLSQGFRR